MSAATNEEEWVTPPSTPPQQGSKKLLSDTDQELKQDSLSVNEPSSLAHKLSVPRNHVFEICAEIASEVLKHYESHPKSAHSDRFIKCCLEIQQVMKEVDKLVLTLQSIAPLFDLDENTPGNGYRSIVCVTDTCILHLIRLLRLIDAQKNSMVFRSAYFCKELEAHTDVLHFMNGGLKEVTAYLDVWPKGYLFPNEDQSSTMRDLLDRIDLLDPSCFYGRGIGFQFCTSVSRVFQVIGVALAAYSVSWEKSSGARTSFGSIIHSGKLLLSPELRAKQIVKVVTHADIGLCKGFWNLSDGALLTQVPAWLCPKLAINETVQIPAEDSLYVEGLDGAKVEVAPPSSHTGKRPVVVRVMSYTHRGNMMKIAKKSTKNAEEDAVKSPNLLFHCHGGGFVATSSKAHETYLRHWSKLLDCPVVSVDYSLAPENPFPRPLEEVLYAYAWVLNNADSFGWTGERICFAGDSAGGNLVTATTLKAIEMGFKRLPDGLVLMYTPFLFQFDPSPSRLLSLMDPLLPMGILIRCLGAYAGCYGATKSQLARDRRMVSPTSHKSIQEYFKEIQNGKMQAPDLGGDQDILSLVNLDNTPPSTQDFDFSTNMRPSQSCASHLGRRPETVHCTKKEPDSPKRVVFRLEPEVENYPKEMEEASSPEKKLKQESRLRCQSIAIGESNSEMISDEVNQLERSSSLQYDKLLRNASADSVEDPEAVSRVEIHRDPSRIWLSSSIYDHDFVDYLSNHDKTKDSLVLVEMSGENEPTKLNKSNVEINGKRPLQAEASIGQTVGDEADDTFHDESGNALAGRPFEISRSRSKSMTSMKKSWSMTFTDTVVLATGHVLDNLGGLVEDSRKKESATPPNLLSQEEEDARNPLAALRRVAVPKNPFLSPLYAPDEWLMRLPKVKLVACHLDPLLDDSIEFARRIRKLGGKVDLDMLDSLPHGFLNFTLMSPECTEAAKLCLTRIKEVLDKGKSC